jgi:hypothetical protein
LPPEKRFIFYIGHLDRCRKCGHEEVTKEPIPDEQYQREYREELRREEAAKAAKQSVLPPPSSSDVRTVVASGPAAATKTVVKPPRKLSSEELSEKFHDQSMLRGDQTPRGGGRATPQFAPGLAKAGPTYPHGVPRWPTSC